MAYLDAVPTSWLRTVATPLQSDCDDGFILVDVDEGNPMASMNVSRRHAEDDNSETFTSDDNLTKENLNGLSDEHADPSSNLVAVGILVRDFADMAICSKPEVFSAGTQRVELNIKNSVLSSTTDNQKEIGTVISVEDNKSMSSVSEKGVLTKPQMGLEIVEKDGRRARYLSEFPKSWLQSKRVPGMSHPNANFSRVPFVRTLGLPRRDLNRSFFRNKKYETQPRGSRSDVLVYHPGKRSKSTFIGREHFELDATTVIPHNAPDSNDSVFTTLGTTAVLPEPIFELQPRDAPARVSNNSTTSTTSKASVSSMYSVIPSFGNRRSHGDAPTKFRK